MQIHFPSSRNQRQMFSQCGGNIQLPLAYHVWLNVQWCGRRKHLFTLRELLFYN